MEISEKTIRFIQEHAKDDTNALRLKYGGKSKKMDFPIEFALLQIESRRKAQNKIPGFLKNPKFVFPDALAAEQASNETIARFHASLVLSGGSLLDLTAGLGVDDLTFAGKGINVTACEINDKKSLALEHNAQAMDLAHRIQVLNVDSMEYVRECKQHYDTVFSDPARRSTTGGRLHALSECQPDILGNMEAVLNITDRLLIKSSPLLDLSLIRDSVDNLSRIYVVCLKGECKEVLIDIEKGKDFSGVTVVDFDRESLISSFHCDLYPHSTGLSIYYADRTTPKDYLYLYEPNAGIMKTGAWGELQKQFPDLRKADANTHLFLSDTLIAGFPGRTLAIYGEPDKKVLKGMKGTKCNVVARNYPLGAPEVAKKHALIPGGDRFLYAFRYKGKPVAVLAETVSRELKAAE